MKSIKKALSTGETQAPSEMRILRIDGRPRTWIESVKPVPSLRSRATCSFEAACEAVWMAAASTIPIQREIFKISRFLIRVSARAASSGS